MIATVPPLSQSRHERLACPASYVSSEVYGNKSPDNEWSALGNEVDALLFNWCVHNMREKSDVTDQIHLEHMLSCAGFDAAGIVRHFLDNFTLNFRHLIGAQVYLTGGDDLEGTLDALLYEGSGNYRVIDFKNYFRVFAPETFQSKLYPVLVFLNYPAAKRVEFTLAFTRYGCVRTVAYTRDDMPRLMELIQASRGRQLDMHANPKVYESQAMPGSQCIYCPLLRQRGCPIEGRNPMEMDITDRLQWQVYLKHAARENDAVLKDFAMHGDIETPGKDGKTLKGGFVLKTTKQYPMGPALVLLNNWKETTEGKDDLIADLHVSRSALESKLKAKKRAILDQAMEDIAVEEMRTQFEITEEA